jgi:hypothetical protein
MSVFSFLPVLFILLQFVIVGVVVYFIYKWVNRFFFLKQEQNDLLREIAKKMDHR